MKDDEVRGMELAEVVVDEIRTMEKEAAPMPALPIGSIYESPQAFEHMQRIAKVFSASSQLVPQNYRQNVADCIIAVEVANQLNIHPLIFMQNTAIVNGKPAMEAKLVIALVNTRGPFEGGIQFSLTGKPGADDRTCEAWAVHKQTGERVSQSMSIAEVKKWGWWEKRGKTGENVSLWPKMPDQMLCYRTAVFLARRYCPEILMGFQTREELQDLETPKLSLGERLKQRSAV